MTCPRPAKRPHGVPASGRPDRVDPILDYLHGRNPDLDLTVKAVAMRLSRAAHWVELQVKRQLAPLGIELWELDILATLARTGGVAPIGQLQDAAQVSAGAMTNRLTRLEAGGHITRSIDAHDRRQIVVALTRTGRRRATTVIEANDRAQREALQHMGMDLLGRLREDLREFLLMAEGSSASASDLDR